MITEEKKQEYLKGWKKRKRQKEKKVKEKKKTAREKVNLIVQKLKKEPSYICEYLVYCSCHLYPAGNGRC